jgi:glutamate synthase domain-containing protein 2
MPLDIDDKSRRVVRYHAAMIENLLQLVAAVRLNSPGELRRWHMQRKFLFRE